MDWGVDLREEESVPLARIHTKTFLVGIFRVVEREVVEVAEFPQITDLHFEQV